MGLGLDPLGTGLGPFGGPGLITIKGVVPVGMSEIAIVLDRVPKLYNDGAYDDASDLSNYILLPIDPTEILPDDKVFIPEGKFVPTHGAEIVGATLDPADEKQIILVTDSALEKWVDYELTLLYVKGVDDEDFAGPNVFPFRGLTPGKVIQGKKAALAVPQDPYLDIANNFDAKNADGSVSLKGWQLESSQQFVKAGGLANTRKRIVRRIFAGRGRYLIYGSDYGVDLRPKLLVRPGDLQRLENNIAAQIRREPDVRSAFVACTVDPSGQMLNIEARVDVRVFGLVSVRQQVAIP